MTFETNDNYSIRFEIKTLFAHHYIVRIVAGNEHLYAKPTYRRRGQHVQDPRTEFNGLAGSNLPEMLEEMLP